MSASCGMSIGCGWGGEAASVVVPLSALDAVLSQEHLEVLPLEAHLGGCVRDVPAVALQGVGDELAFEVGDRLFPEPPLQRQELPVGSRDVDIGGE